MEANDLLDSFLVAEQNIDSLWQFFVSVHLAIFGAFFTIKTIRRHQLSIFIASYILFTIINIRAKINEYLLYTSIAKELQTKLDANSEILNFYNNFDTSDRILILYTIHIISFIFILILSYKLIQSQQHYNNLTKN